MLLLLPPSESKTAPAGGDPVSLDALGFPELSVDRARLMNILARVSAQKNALSTLGVGPSVAGDVARNLTLTEAPAGPALTVYSGVLYDALDVSSLSDGAHEAMTDSVVVVSALWGVVRPADRITAYRLSMGTALPRTGKLSTWWKPRLTPVLDHAARDGMVVDCRSAAYAAAWKPPAARTLAVRVEQARADGTRTVVSHAAKHTRGLVTRHLCEHRAGGGALDTPEDIHAALSTRWTAELVHPAAGRSGSLTVVLDPA